MNTLRSRIRQSLPQRSRWQNRLSSEAEATRVRIPILHPRSSHSKSGTVTISGPGAGHRPGGGGSYSKTRYLPFLAAPPALLLAMSSVHAQVDSDTDEELHASSRTNLPPSPAIQSIPTSTLVRTYLVYALCSLPLLIDHSPTILHYMTHSPIPGLKGVTEFLVRNTFFAQFVPGETVGECLPEMSALRTRGVGSVLNYSAEAEVEEGDVAGKRDLEQRRLEEVERALRISGEFERSVEEKGGKRGSTAFALKVTGLIDPAILARASTTLLRLRPLTLPNSPSHPNALSPSSQVPYPGTPLSADVRVVARPLPDTADENVLCALKGEVKEMGVLESDEGVQKGDLEELARLWDKLRGLGNLAKENGVKLMIDAEHTYYQPALDAYTLLLSQEFNKPPSRGIRGSPSTEEWTGPLIFGTYQSYLARQPQHLIAALRHAETNGYALGIKLVRGAYFVQERQKWKAEGRHGADPIWPDSPKVFFFGEMDRLEAHKLSKPSTDKAYNTSISTILSTLASQLASPKPEHALSVVFGTHNPESVDLVLDNLVKNGLAESGGKQDEGGAGRLLKMRKDVIGKVFVAQLYGMKDDLTDKVAESFEPNGMPVALKYIAYGSLGEVLPFLGRRAIENKSVMTGEGGATAERGRVSKELWRRWFG